MRFHVVGADKESGNDIEVDVTAVDRADAEAVATKRGVLVCAVEAIKDADPEPIPLADIELAGPAKAAPKEESGGTRAGIDPAMAHVANGAAAKAASVAGASVAGTSGGSLAGGTASPAASQAPASSGDTQAQAGDGHPTAAAGAHMEYHVIMNQSLYLLELAVNKHIKMGWEPQGSLTIGVWNNAMQYFQAVIRHKE